jgi:hypothetical protein
MFSPKWEVNVMTQTLKRLAMLTMSILALAVVVVPASYAGEDNSCSDNNTCHKSGGSDTGSASGGASTGFGGMAATNDNNTLAISLASGGILVLTAAGLASRRRKVALDA